MSFLYLLITLLDNFTKRLWYIKLI